MSVSFGSLQRQWVVFATIVWTTLLWQNVTGFLAIKTRHTTLDTIQVARICNNAYSDGGDGFTEPPLNRRQLLSYLAALSFVISTPAKSDSPLKLISGTSSVTVPLEFTGQELLIYYRVDGSLFRAVVDTGSPFLLIPGSCGANTRSKAGCYREQGIPSGLPDTFEQFDGFEGNVEWRLAPVTFVNATGSLMTKQPLITLGVASESILGGPGGVFFGLIRDTESWIRPSLLGQTSVCSFQLDLRTSQKELTLSQEPMIHSEQKSIRLTSDLRRKYGDPVTHYTARAESITVNGLPLVEQGIGQKPIYVIFDTGVTGMVVSRELFDERYATARRRREKNLWGQVDVTFRSIDGKTIVLSANKPLTTPFDPQQNWSKFRGHLIVIGLSFLDGNRITIDIDRKNLLLES